MNLGGGPGADVLTAYLRILSGFSRDGRLYLLASALLGLTYWGGIASVLANLYLLRLGYGPEFIGLCLLRSAGWGCGPTLGQPASDDSRPVGKRSGRTVATHG